MAEWEEWNFIHCIVPPVSNIKVLSIKGFIPNARILDALL